MAHLRRKHARYGPLDRYLPPPSGGLCISVAVVISRRGRFLLGRAQEHPRWRKEWFSNWLMYDAEELRAHLGRLHLPSTYLWEGEHPAQAARRVLRDQLCSGRYSLHGPVVYSYDSRSTSWYPGERHWDIVFVYTASAALPARRPPWWAELRWCTQESIIHLDHGWNEDFFQDLGLLPPRRGTRGRRREDHRPVLARAGRAKDPPPKRSSSRGRYDR